VVDAIGAGVGLVVDAIGAGGAHTGHDQDPKSGLTHELKKVARRYMNEKFAVKKVIAHLNHAPEDSRSSLLGNTLKMADFTTGGKGHTMLKNFMFHNKNENTRSEPLESKV